MRPTAVDHSPQAKGHVIATASISRAPGTGITPVSLESKPHPGTRSRILYAEKIQTFSAQLRGFTAHCPCVPRTPASSAPSIFAYGIYMNLPCFTSVPHWQARINPILPIRKPIPYRASSHDIIFLVRRRRSFVAALFRHPFFHGNPLVNERENSRNFPCTAFLSPRLLSETRGTPRCQI
jgi:hypothetical protein